ncbi:MAG: RNA polymerase sigma factor, partial [Verrucomicrobiales bacterium]
MIQRAGQGSHADLEVLCTQYWYPLYAYARHGGRTPEDAEDLTQSFVSKLIEKHWVEQASEQDCTFRSFLLIRF